MSVAFNNIENLVSRLFLKLRLSSHGVFMQNKQFGYWQNLCLFKTSLFSSRSYHRHKREVIPFNLSFQFLDNFLSFLSLKNFYLVICYKSSSAKENSWSWIQQVHIYSILIQKLLCEIKQRFWWVFAYLEQSARWQVISTELKMTLKVQTARKLLFWRS